MDINQWRLEYEGHQFDFGIFDDGSENFPLKTQVDLGDYTRALQDYDQASADGTVMGMERLGGMTLTFTCTVVPDPSDTGDKWDRPLDLFRQFRREWRADSVRRIPGKYATLTNLAREVSVFGRPRKCAPTLDLIRKGGADWVAEFVTMDPSFYNNQWRGGDLLTNGATMNIDFPSLGDVNTWPIIAMQGNGKATVTLQKGDSSSGILVWRDLWSVASYANMYVATLPDTPWENLQPEIAGWRDDAAGSYRPGPGTTVAGAIPLFVDTRPWSRGILAMDSATGKRDPLQGAVLSTSLDQMFLPATEGMRFKMVSTHASVTAKVFWQKAYAGL